ncbi:hydroxyethylthiazole kinase [Acinetobacter calcoaceticus]|uniref:Hydroxyethylthiazole kinase n=1 Tax=Acinetobacter calcoaceticus TaxID=471 RepID=A0A4R1XF33_ACICA|nr:hydroxyethylthiazole kinase [Acinetobacter calcoaceticus]
MHNNHAEYPAHPPIDSTEVLNTPMTDQVLLDQVISAWTLLQQQQPLVQCISNSVAANYVANILLAAGASPAMIDHPQEAQGFAAVCSALSINLGTPTLEQMQAMYIAAETAHLQRTPWVLDPVGYGSVLQWRSQAADQLLKFKPNIIRGNASEISALAGHQTQTKGVDSTLSSRQVYLQAQSLLQHSECVAISGVSDYILSKKYQAVIQIDGGSALQPRVTATGCALGALTAAYAAVTDSTIAAIAAHVHFAIAGQLAAVKTQQLGSFNVAFLDYIHAMDSQMIEQFAQINIIDILPPLSLQL